LSGILCGTILSGIASVGAAPALAACPGNCQGIVICEWVDVPCGSAPDGGHLYCLQWRCVEDCRDCERPSFDDFPSGPGSFPEIPNLPIDPVPFPF
jgi:hypothetical protein